MEFEISEDRVWTPVHTRPRCEKKFMTWCEKFSITAYLPLRIKAKTIGKKVYKSFIPMFPGYTFAWLNSESKHKINQTNTVVSFIDLNRPQEESLVRDLRGIVLMEHMQELDELEVSPEITVGKEVKIKSGPLRGLFGIVQKRKGVHRVVVNVEMISQSVSMEIDASDVVIGV